MTKATLYLKPAASTIAWVLSGAVLLPAAALFPTAVAFAQTADQDAPDLGNGEIVVTATRRAEALSKVPQSISAMSQESLDMRGIKDLGGVVRQTPGIQLDPNGFGNQTNIAIRGVSSTVGAATTGIYIDDTPIQSRSIGYSTTNAFPSVFDLQRVEVLRGPQGTLFGAGSEGGTVRFITTQPSLADTRIYSRAEAAGTEGGAMSGEFGVSVTAPVVADKLGFAASIWFRRDGGWIDRSNAHPALADTPYYKNVNSTNTQVGRFALKWRPVDRLEITPSLFYQKRVTHDSSTYWETLSDPSSGTYVNGQPNASPDRDRFYLPALNISYDFGGLQFINNGSYYVRDQSAEIDYSTSWPSIFDGTPFIDPSYNSLAYMTNSQRTFTEEARLQSNDPAGRFNWVLGVFYSHTVQRFTENVYDPDFSLMFGGTPPELIFGTPLVDGTYSLSGYGKGTDEQLAGFVEANFALTRQLKLTAGVRVSHTKFAGSSLFDGPVSGYQLQQRQSVSENPITPKFSVDWQASSNIMFYATAAKGYRIGGTNAPVPLSTCGADMAGFGFSQVPGTYKSDSLWSYEAGAKGKLGSAVSFAASVFHVDWKDIQQNVSLPHCGAQFTANMGNARSDGFDMQATVKLSRALTLDGTLAYTNARLTHDVGGGALAASGDHLETHPWTATIGANYEMPVGRESTLYLRGDYQYKSKGRITTQTDPVTNSYDPGAINQPEMNFASVRAGVRTGPFDLSLFIDNVTNETSILSRSIVVSGVGSYTNISLRPRTFGLTLLMRQ